MSGAGLGGVTVGVALVRVVMIAGEVAVDAGVVSRLGRKRARQSRTLLGLAVNRVTGRAQALLSGAS